MTVSAAVPDTLEENTTIARHRFILTNCHRSVSVSSAKLRRIARSSLKQKEREGILAALSRLSREHEGEVRSGPGNCPSGYYGDLRYLPRHAFNQLLEHTELDHYPSPTPPVTLFPFSLREGGRTTERGGGPRGKVRFACYGNTVKGSLL